MLINELLVVRDNGLGYGLTDSIDLRCVSTTGNSDADIDVGELVQAHDQKGLVDLESKDLGLDEVEGLSVNFYDSFTSLFSFLSVFRAFRSP